MPQVIAGASIADMSALLGAGWEIIWLDPEAMRAAELLGYAPERITGRVLWEVLPGLHTSPLGEALRESVATGRPTETELTFGDPPRWYELRCAPVAGQLQLHCRDVTRRHEAEERLRRSEELLRSAQQLAHIGSWEWEVGSRDVTWSDELFRIFGREPGGGAVDYAVYLSCLHPDDRHALAAAIDGAIAGQPFELEHRIVRPDGSVRRVLGSGGRLSGGDGRPDRLVGTAQDVTERREADDARRRLAEAEAARGQVEAILDTIGELFIACDRDWRLRFINAKTERYLGELGLTRHDMVGRRIWEVMPDLVRSRFHQAALQAVREQRPVEVEARYDPIDRWFSARIVPSADGAVCYARDISERKRAEAAARESHELLQAVFDGTSEAIFVKDLAGRYLLANRAAVAALGLTLEELIGHTDAEVFDPATAARLREDDAAVLRSGGTATFEESIPRYGSIQVHLSTKSVLRGAGGAPTGLVGVARDITDRIRAEAAVRASERRQRFLAEASAVLNASLDYEGTLESIARLAAGSLADLCAVDLHEDDGSIRRVAVAHRDPAMQQLAAELRRFPPPVDSASPIAVALRTGRTEVVRSTDDEHFRLTARGPEHLELLRRLDVRSTIAVPLVAHGRTLGVVSLVATGEPRTYSPDDIALAEELAVRAAFAVDNARLYGAAQTWARIFEHAGWGVLIVSADGRTIEAMNPAFARIHGYGADELVGQEVARLLPPDAAETLAGHYATALRLGRHVYELRHTRRDGSVFPVRVDIAPVRGADHAVEHWALNVQDLTAQRRAEEQVHQAQKMEAVGRLAGGLAHDFNNMLMIIIGFSDLLYASLDGDDPRQGDAEEIRKAAERASALTQQLLAFGRDSLMPSRPLDLNEVIRGVEGMLRPVVGEHIEVVSGLDAALAPVLGDRGQLEQVLMNLALNARDAMPRGGRLTIETANVEFATGHAYRTFGIDLPAGRYVMLVVNDTGGGMDAETRGRIFEPFFTTKQERGNSGLGLATVYAIVTRNGGSIWVDSEPGRGTTFTLCFPPAAAAAAGTLEQPRVAARGGSETVLVVEDEQAVRNLACRVLREQGYDVLQAANGEEALDILTTAEREVHLVVSDVVMPAMNGRELSEHLSELRPGLPLLYMSGYTDGDMLQIGVQTSARNFLPKPFAPEALVVRVREMLDRQDGRRRPETAGDG